MKEDLLITMAENIEKNGCDNCPCEKGCYVQTNNLCIGRIVTYLKKEYNYKESQ